MENTTAAVARNERLVLLEGYGWRTLRSSFGNALPTENNRCA